MIFSLSEIESLSRKAAKGAGHPWGVAEEAGKCARYLCAAGLPGAEALAGLLQAFDQRPYDECRPDCSATPWQAANGPLCPIITGAAICDRAADVADGQTITLGLTAHPLLLLPAIASASDILESGISIHWAGLTMTRMNRETWIETDDQAIRVAEQSEIIIARASSQSGARIRRSYRAEISEETREALNTLAHRTYAPDTPESRLSGAGAGLTDND